MLTEPKLPSMIRYRRGDVLYVFTREQYNTRLNHELIEYIPEPEQPQPYVGPV